MGQACEPEISEPYDPSQASLDASVQIQHLEIAEGYHSAASPNRPRNGAHSDHAQQAQPVPSKLKLHWYLDEVVITIGGKKHWLWRAVDQAGYVLDEIIQGALPVSPLGRSRVRWRPTA